MGMRGVVIQMSIWCLNIPTFCWNLNKQIVYFLLLLFQFASFCMRKIKSNCERRKTYQWNKYMVGTSLSCALLRKVGKTVTLPGPCGNCCHPKSVKGPCLFPLFKSCGLLGGPLLVDLHAQRVERWADRAGQRCELWSKFPSLTSDRRNNVQVLFVDVKGKNLVSNKISWWTS